MGAPDVASSDRNLVQNRMRMVVLSFASAFPLIGWMSVKSESAGDSHFR
jgi:hypothetical protein